ncbi:MAG: hypothetical protein M9962_14465, partial [Oligoflexia bacterium]|nr:hypothetical protein [Oligoflexia bacterium]
MTKMNTRERAIAIAILFITAAFVSIDIISDIKEGSSWQHAAIEGTFVFIALIGVLFLLRNSF